MAAILGRSLLRCLQVARPRFIQVPPRQGGNLADWKSSPPAQSAWGDWTVLRKPQALIWSSPRVSPASQHLK